MSEKRFTPGPWRVLPLDGKHYGTQVELSNGYWVEVWGTQEGGLSRTPGDPNFPSERELRHLDEPSPGSEEWKEWFCDGHWESTADLANAHLIAAAPDMLEALCELESVLCNGSFESPVPGEFSRFAQARAAARTAISKALGE